MEKRDGIALVIAAFFFIFLYCILSTPVPIAIPDVYARPLPQGCMVYSLAFQNALNARALLDDRCHWSDIIGIKFKGADLYHAVLVYEFNNGTWIYDCNLGSFELSNKRLIDIKEIVSAAYPDCDVEDTMWLRSDLDHHDNYGFPE